MKCTEGRCEGRIRLTRHKQSLIIMQRGGLLRAIVTECDNGHM